jgi:hypothetical protein
MNVIQKEVAKLKSKLKARMLLDPSRSVLETWSSLSPNEQNRIILLLVASSCILTFLVVLGGLFLFVGPTSAPSSSTTVIDKTGMDRDIVDGNTRPDPVTDDKKDELRESIELFREEASLRDRVSELNMQIEQELIEGLDREEKAAAEARKIAAAEQRKKEAAAQKAQNASRNQLQTQQICERLTNRFDYLEFNNASDAALVEVQKQKNEAGCSS